jgi:hypothetical protein
MLFFLRHLLILGHYSPFQIREEVFFIWVA